MPARPTKGVEKAGVSFPVIVGAIALLLLFIGWLAYRNFVPPPHASGPTPESKNDWISQLAKQTRGDFSKLDPATQKKMNVYTGGKGAELLKSKYEAATH